MPRLTPPRGPNPPIPPALVSSLRSTTIPWSEQVSALQGLSTVAIDTPSSQHDSLIRQLRDLAHPLSILVSSLRSMLVKETCRTISTLAERLGPPFAQAVAEQLIPALLKRVCNTKAVIRDSALTAAKAIFEHGVVGLSLNTAKLLATSVQDRKLPSSTRAAAAQFVGMILVEDCLEGLVHIGEVIEAAIVAGCQDSDESVRAISRENWHRLHELDSSFAREMLPLLAPQVASMLLRKGSPVASDRSFRETPPHTPPTPPKNLGRRDHVARGAQRVVQKKPDFSFEGGPKQLSEKTDAVAIKMAGPHRLSPKDSALEKATGYNRIGLPPKIAQRPEGEAVAPAVKKTRMPARLPRRSLAPGVLAQLRGGVVNESGHVGLVGESGDHEKDDRGGEAMAIADKDEKRGKEYKSRLPRRSLAPGMLANLRTGSLQENVKAGLSIENGAGVQRVSIGESEERVDGVKCNTEENTVTDEVGLEKTVGETGESMGSETLVTEKSGLERDGLKDSLVIDAEDKGEPSEDASSPSSVATTSSDPNSAVALHDDNAIDEAHHAASNTIGEQEESVLERAEELSLTPGHNTQDSCHNSRKGRISFLLGVDVSPDTKVAKKNGTGPRQERSHASDMEGGEEGCADGAQPSSGELKTLRKFPTQLTRRREYSPFATSSKISGEAAGEEKPSATDVALLTKLPAITNSINEGQVVKSPPVEVAEKSAVPSDVMGRSLATIEAGEIPQPIVDDVLQNPVDSPIHEFAPEMRSWEALVEDIERSMAFSSDKNSSSSSGEDKEGHANAHAKQHEVISKNCVMDENGKENMGLGGRVSENGVKSLKEVQKTEPKSNEEGHPRSNRGGVKFNEGEATSKSNVAGQTKERGPQKSVMRDTSIKLEGRPKEEQGRSALEVLKPLAPRTGMLDTRTAGSRPIKAVQTRMQKVRGPRRSVLPEMLAGLNKNDEAKGSANKMTTTSVMKALATGSSSSALSPSETGATVDMQKTTGMRRPKAGATRRSMMPGTRLEATGSRGDDAIKANDEVQASSSGATVKEAQGRDGSKRKMSKALQGVIEWLKRCMRLTRGGWQEKSHALSGFGEACKQLQGERLGPRLAEDCVGMLSDFVQETHHRVVRGALDGVFFLLLCSEGSSLVLQRALERHEGALRRTLGLMIGGKEDVRLAAGRVMQSFEVQFTPEVRVSLVVRAMGYGGGEGRRGVGGGGLTDARVAEMGCAELGRAFERAMASGEGFIWKAELLEAVLKGLETLKRDRRVGVRRGAEKVVEAVKGSLPERAFEMACYKYGVVFGDKER